jgi:hypothetical protein
VFKPTRLLDQLREQIRYRHYSLRTEEAYVYWVKKFIHFHQKRHPHDTGQAQVEAFLTHMAVERKVSVSPIAKHSVVCSLQLNALGPRPMPSTQRSADELYLKERCGNVSHVHAYS